MSVSPSIVVIDDKVDAYSTNPVQNKAIYNYLQNDLSAEKVLDAPIASFFDGSLEKVDNSITTYLTNYALINQKNLQSVTLSNCTTIGVRACAYADNLTEVIAPKVSSVEAAAFSYCRKLEVVDFRNTPSYGMFNLIDVQGSSDMPFYGCYRLLDIWLGGIIWEINKDIPASNLFTSLPYNYTIHVPTNSLANYQADSQWSSVSNHLVGFSS